MYHTLLGIRKFSIGLRSWTLSWGLLRPFKRILSQLRLITLHILQPNCPSLTCYWRKKNKKHKSFNKLHWHKSGRLSLYSIKPWGHWYINYIPQTSMHFQLYAVSTFLGEFTNILLTKSTYIFLPTSKCLKMQVCPKNTTLFVPQT